MTKTFCDRCKEEIVGIIPSIYDVAVTHKNNSISSFVICQRCLNSLQEWRWRISKDHHE